MLKRRFMHPLVAVLVLVSMLLQGTWVLAGTTGSLTGTITDSSTGTAIAQAKVTVTSPSQTVSTTTDNGGHFTFASLAPDTYTVSVEKQGYDPLAQSGINVFADAGQTLGLKLSPPLKTVARVVSRSSTDLVKPGTTADVYSVNATQQEKFAGVGGGGGLNNAYSAIATVPGAYVPANQAGYFQTISIRGGDYDQVGYEVDGIPVNRSFDNYPAGTASSLGQQELQVYTGAAPANAEGQGLSGFINQVIRTGTYPGFANLDLGLGGPSFYHKASFEFGGASPNRNFSYYVGLGGYDQDFRYVDQGNGQAFQAYGPILGSNVNTGIPVLSYQNGAGDVALGGVTTTPIDLGQVSNLVDRDTVVNVHFGIPHHKDGSKDDIQLLYVNNFLRSYFFSSPNDVGNANYASVGAGTPYEFDAYSYTGAVGAPLASNPLSQIVPYYFPRTGNGRAFDSAIPADNRDTYQNDQALFKVQYQKNFSSNAYFRLYGYTGYSDWLQNGQDFTYNTYNVGGVVDAVSADYNLFSHTRGISGTFADQINSQNLLQLQGSYTTASTVRDNNTQMLQSASSSRDRFATVVSSANPTNGVCYNVSSGTAVAANCDSTGGATNQSSYLRFSKLENGTQTPANLTGLSCGGAACEYYAVENGNYGTFNTVKPNFIGSSLTDTFKPNDKLVLNLGLRFDDFQYDGADTTASPARTLFFNSFNLNHCVNNGVVSTLSATPLSASGGAGTPAQVTAACQAAGLGVATNLQNTPSQIETYPVFQPRAGATFTINSDTVLRASYGRYAQAPNTAYEQYNYLQQNSPAQLGSAFYKYGFTTPGHQVTPEVSNNYDFSVEHHFKGSDVSFKLTPFYRYTQNQIQNFFLDQASGFVSGLNADRLTTRGIEFQLNKGDFARDGFAGQLSFTYTNAYAKYNSFGNGSTVFSGINNDIQTYNAYTKACATGTASKSICGSTSNGLTATPCYTTVGTPDPTCAAGSIANPYWNAPAQPLVDVNGNYTPFSLITGPIGASADGYIVPYVTQLILNYKKGPLSITPSFGFTAGQRYGVPETSPGIDPASGCAALASSVAGDPRYPYGAPGGSSYDATMCAANLNAIPDPFTNKFDGIGDFVNPSNITANLQLSYQASKYVTFTANFANIINNCFGGSKEPWTTGGSNVCSYGLVDGGNSFQYVGNSYNPLNSTNPTPVAPVVSSPYQRSYGVFNTDGSSTKLPFNVYVDAKIKL
jgi:hypothetical protein